MKNFMKFTSVLLCLAMLITLTILTACNNKGGENQSTDTTAAPDEEVKNTLTLALDPSVAPYQYTKDDKIVGVNVDMVAALTTSLNMELALKNVSSDALIASVLDGSCTAALINFEVTDAEQLEKLYISDPIMTARQVVLVPTDSAITSIADLTGKTVGVKTGMPDEAAAKEKLGADNVKNYTSYNNAVEAIATGDIDAVILDSTPAATIVAANQDVKLLSGNFASTDYMICTTDTNYSLADNLINEFSAMQNTTKISSILGEHFTDTASAE